MADVPEKPVAAPQAGREFAFSRVAGVSPGEYAAVSTTAVVAVIVAALGAIALFWVWGLLICAASLLTALLALYYIATSAGTLTGRKIALAAIVASVALGLTASAVHLLDHRCRQAELKEVLTLADQAGQCLAAQDFDAFYEQLSEQYRQDVPPGWWTYQWRRFLGGRGRPTRIELGPRSRVVTPDRIAVTLLLHFGPIKAAEESGGAARIVPLRLFYRRFHGDGHDEAADEEGEPDSHAVPGQTGWRLNNLPGVISILPPRYVEPLVWPAPGKLLMFIQDDQGQTEAALVAPSAGTALPADRAGRLIGAVALPPLVPPMEAGPSARRWLLQRPPPPVQPHRH